MLRSDKARITHFNRWGNREHLSGTFLISLYRQYSSVRTGRMSWLFMSAGAGVIFYTFIGDYAGIVIKGGFVPDVAGLANNNVFQKAVASFVLVHFDWWIFSAGEALIILSGVAVYVRTMNK